jgi:hypothetical protein
MLSSTVSTTSTSFSRTPRQSPALPNSMLVVSSGFWCYQWYEALSVLTDQVADRRPDVRGCSRQGLHQGHDEEGRVLRVSEAYTTPSTIYKKQKLDRDDIIDITDLDVVAWLKGEMRLMLDEELARAVLIGDGREVDDEDKIKDPAGATEGAGIRSIANDHDLYAATMTLPIDLTARIRPMSLMNCSGMRFYKGSGSPTFYTTLPVLTWLLLARDGMNRRYYRTASDLATELGCFEHRDR